MYVGVDTSTKSICIGSLEAIDDYEWEWTGLGGTLFEKMAEAYFIIDQWLVSNFNDELVVGVEEPIYIQNGTTHKVLCCIYSMVIKAFLDWGIIPNPINISTWKKRVVGKGNANKEMVRDYMVDHLKLPIDLEQDIYDALAVSLYMRGGNQNNTTE